jgi:phosphatidylserine/phosphatidylglycerophosphate/cardiolipin synthase-like enzyme
MRLSLNQAIPILSAITILASCQTSRYSAGTEREQDRGRREVAQEQLVTANQQPPEYLAPQSFDMLSQYVSHKYEVLFTDPKCGVYKYKDDVTVKSQSGQKLTQKPENVYCKNMYDLKRSGDREESPQHKLVDWISQPSTTEIYFTYLSFSNKAVKNALCDAAKRGVKIKFVLDKGQDMTRADELLACGPTIERKLRGGVMGMAKDVIGKDLIGLAHNKFLIINPNTPGEFKVVFSSGNMTSGPVIHHENWNFITTNSQSQFAQAHLCAMNAEWSDVSGVSRSAYIKSIRDCRKNITAPVEKDVKVFFVPGEGQPEKGVTDGIKTASEYMVQGDGVFPGINSASKIWIGAHRFSNATMLTALSKAMSKKVKPELKIVADDDTFYAGKPEFKGLTDVQASEYYNIKKLVDVGGSAKFMETNMDEHQLHHSKYLIFADKKGNFTSVFTGSANLTSAAFNVNWENSYYINIPEVAQQFADHYVKMWDTMATAPENLPSTPSVLEMLVDQPEIK